MWTYPASSHCWSTVKNNQRHHLRSFLAFCKFIILKFLSEKKTWSKKTSYYKRLFNKKGRPLSICLAKTFQMSHLQPTFKQKKRNLRSPNSSFVDTPSFMFRSPLRSTCLVFRSHETGINNKYRRRQKISKVPLKTPWDGRTFYLYDVSLMYEKWINVGEYAIPMDLLWWVN